MNLVSALFFSSCLFSAIVAIQQDEKRFVIILAGMSAAYLFGALMTLGGR